MGLLVASAIVSLLNWNAGIRSVLRSLGLRRDGILSGFLWANAFLLPLTIFLLGMVLATGPESLLANAPVPLPTAPIPLWYPLFASTAWVFGGSTAFPFLQAYPYEKMIDRPKKCVIPLVALLWVGIYNAPLVTGVVISDDIVFFGILFTVAYHKSRNSIGLVATYVLAELPVWSLVAGTWGGGGVHGRNTSPHPDRRGLGRSADLPASRLLRPCPAIRAKVRKTSLVVL